MARARRPNEPSSYERRPEVPPELQPRYARIREILGGQRSISEAAETLGMARPNLQALVHRVETAILEALQPRPTGPKPKPAAVKELETRIEQLSKENEKLKRQLQAADDMMMAAGEIIRDLRGMRPSTRSSASRTSSTRARKPPKPSPEDPERAKHVRPALTRLQDSNDLGGLARRLGLDLRRLRRWLARLVAGEPIVKPRGGTPRRGTPAAESRVRELVEALHGLAGAASLARSVSGVSRRRAAEIKSEVLTARERDRKSECARVEIRTPGVVRGFDAMHLEGAYALGAADGCVPFRTSLRRVPSYDAEQVAAVLDEDFQTYGAPLVLREDRARCQTAPAVMSVLERHKVLVLQGPAYYAPYYGQLERQNREHRAWCAWLVDARRVSQADLDRMKTTFNERWLRPRLGWRSAAECWNQRGPIDDDRVELRDDVERRAAALRSKCVQPDLAMRLAIEQALIARGHLRITPGRAVLCD